MGGDAGRAERGGHPFDATLDAAIGTAFHQSPVAMVCTDLQLRVVRVNEVFCRLLGLPAEQLLGLRPSEYSGGFDGEFIERVVTQQVLDRGAALVDARLTQRMDDGRERNLAWSAFPLLDDGRPLAVFGMLTDVTERMRTVRALERAHPPRPAGTGRQPGRHHARRPAHRRRARGPGRTRARRPLLGRPVRSRRQRLA